MSLFLWLTGIVLTAGGFLWRLREIEQKTAAAALEEAMSGTVQSRRPPASKVSKRTLQTAGAKVAGAEAPHGNTPSAMAYSLRRTERVLLRIPLEVSGTDADGNPLMERTHTQDINRNGASIALRDSLRPAGQVTIKNLRTRQSCRFRVCRATRDLPGGIREWAVECLDPAPNFWGVSFADSPEESGEERVGSLLECTTCHCREMANLTLPEYQTIARRTSLARYCVWCGMGREWKFANAEELAQAKPSEAPEVEGSVAGVDRRHEERRIARLPISIRHEDGREEFSITDNVSRNGLCCSANMNCKSASVSS